MDLLRISTAGSVDDGKSTLIGRLLYDNNALTKEQEELIEKKTAEKGLQDLDFSSITDGLIAEREQGITIDVAHIYFSTQDRKFIIADSPGHVEYTRNMVTGASNAEASIILIDARKGLLEQSYRHYFISQLLRLHTVVFCVNKMDLVNYDEDVFLKIAAEVKQMTAQFEHSTPEIQIIPISSLKGDNVVFPSGETSWYQGPTLNEVLHEISSKKEDEKPFRFEVQNVLHVQNEEFVDFRGYAGKVASGSIKKGDEVVVLPSGNKSTVKEIRKYDRTFDEAHAGESIVLSLNDDIDASRGTVFSLPDEVPSSDKTLDATLVWLNEQKGVFGGRYQLQASSRTVQAKLQQIHYVVPPEKPSLKVDASELKLNDISRVSFKLAQPLFVDAYANNKANGAFIVIDTQTNNTVAVGFVE
ncbi:sulfate adenylyltransferase subunit 1 [Zhouia amylolytica]|uniref:sulfate adenylyltransferase n=1 Tax=Zhouia amylolytica AD3 TaxID=1286632 RepID=W2URK3_9FLAO|nr:GTP-binding protein [Zhouia amylolytica]ETN96770.1 sulfate adenylyltransferase large subunit [Zhouia amylolytica AD3]